MSHPIRTLLFDLDGTLIDSSKDLSFAYNQLLQDNNLPAPDPLQLKSDVAHGINHLIVKDFAAPMGSSVFKKMRRHFTAIYEANLTQQTALFPGMEAVLDFVIASELPWGIVTNKIKRFTQPIIDHFPLLKQTHVLVCGDTVSQSKPDPHPVLYACQQLRAIPAETALVGDTANDALSAKRAGVKSVMVDYNMPLSADMIATWQADAWLHTPEELLIWLQQHTQPTE